jgi:hypothetical protein
MSEKLGADVEGLEQVGKQLSNASTTANTVQGSLNNMAGNLRFYGRFGDEFTGYVSATAAPALGRVAEAMSALSQAASRHAQAQRQVSDGSGALAAGTAAAALGGAAGADALAQRRGAGGQGRAPVGGGDQHYQVLDDSVRMNDEVRRAVGNLADAYHSETGQNITVTDGNRTPADQADRMATRLESGQRLVGFYTDRQAATELEQAYRQATSTGGSPAEVRAAMSETIQNQIDRGVYVSDHLREGAVDVRSRGMTDPEAFQRLAGEQGFRVLDERTLRDGRPSPRPHFHLEYEPPRR